MHNVQTNVTGSKLTIVVDLDSDGFASKSTPGNFVIAKSGYAIPITYKDRRIFLSCNVWEKLISSEHKTTKASGNTISRSMLQQQLIGK